MSAVARSVLAIEDDASMLRLFRLAIEDDPVDLRLCSNVREAIWELGHSAFDLVITDLMLPGESGIGLINRVSAQPGLRQQAELVVLSAGITPQQAADLKQLGVNGFLLKPVSMARLRQLMLHGFSVPSQSEPAESHPVMKYFEGNQVLFDQFAAHCAIQFEMDCKHGDDAARRQDMSGLYTVTHSLSAALEMLGEKDMSNQCKALMNLTKTNSEAERVTRAWTNIGENLMALSKRLRLKFLQ